MSHLVPRQITDKNGVLTTRHVRADNNAVSSEALKTAAPGMVMPERERIAAALAGLFDDENNEIKIDSLSDRDLGYLCNLTEHLHKEADTTVIWKLLNPEKTAMKEHLDPSLMRRFSDELKDLATYHRLDRELPLYETQSLARGLWAYEQALHGALNKEHAQALIDVSHTALRFLSDKGDAFEYPDYDMDGEYRSDLNMFYSFFGGDLEHAQDGSIWIRNQKFVDMVLRRPDDAERISELIEQRQTIQPDIIETMLDSDNHPSLLEGTL